MESAHATNCAWLLKLRWGAAAGQLVIILFARFWLSIAIPFATVLPIIGIECGTNAAAWRWARHRTQVPEAMLAAVMVLNVALLTLLLGVTGGPFNPFNFLYLVHIALAAVVLRPQWAWGLTAMAISCCGALFTGTPPTNYTRAICCRCTSAACGWHSPSRRDSSCISFSG